MRYALLIPLALVPLFIVGCIGGPESDHPHPPAAWHGPSTRLSLPASRPIADVSGACELAVGTTSASPEQVIQIARQLIEPAYGPMKQVKHDLPNGRVLFELLSPRYHLTDFNRSYLWLEVSVNLNPETGKSIVEVHEFTHEHNPPLIFSGHGGFWLFPPAFVHAWKTEHEYALLVAILNALDDPNVSIAKRGDLSH